MVDPPPEERHFSLLDNMYVRDAVEYLYEEADKDDPNSPWSYEVRTGRAPISLGAVEFRILQFLSSQPYRPFTPSRIADAVTTEEFPVTEDTLREHIISLRKKLGILADYIQSVPDMGYRFKA